MIITGSPKYMNEELLINESYMPCSGKEDLMIFQDPMMCLNPVKSVAIGSEVLNLTLGAVKENKQVDDIFRLFVFLEKLSILISFLVA